MRSFIALLALGLVGLTGCSGSGGGNPDGGGSGGDGGIGGTCMAAGMPNTVVDFDSAYSMSVVGQDVYWVSSTANGNRGAVKHAKLDGSGVSEIVTPPMGLVFGVSAEGDDLYYWLSDSNQKVHLFKSPRATGGVGTQLGTDEYDGFSFGGVLGGGIAGIQASESTGVFAKIGTDVFVNEASMISRVSASGVKTVIGQLQGGAFAWPALIGTKILAKDLSGKIYSIDPMASSAAQMQVGTATCGTGRTMFMAAHASGFMCGELFGLDSIDATGTTKTHVIYTLGDKDVIQLNPTNVDGMTYYAMWKDPAKDGAIYKMTVGSNAITPVACGVRAIVDFKMTATDLVYVELRSDKTSMGTTAILTLKRLVR